MYNALSVERWWKDRQRADAVHWTRLSAEASQHANTATGRDDLIVTMEPGSGHGSPAVYIAGTADIEVNPDVCVPGVNPADIDLTTEVGQLRHPELVGALDHEAGHGQFSSWPIDQSPRMRRLMQTALLLEEPIMERDVVAARPERRVYLRASFHKIANRGGAEAGSPAAAAHLACLAHGRVDGGVLDASEVATVIDLCRGILGEERYEQLRQVWLDGMALPVPRTDTDAMAALAQRWLDILGDDADTGDGDNPDRYICGHSHGDDDGEESTGDGSTGDALRAAAEAIAEQAQAEASDSIDAAKARDGAREKAAAAREKAAAEQEAGQVFEKLAGGHGYGYGSEGLSGSRAPLPSEVAQANQLAARLRKAQHRERTRTVVPSTVPPGRLRSREAVRRSAERSMGMIPTAQPWSRTTRKHVQEPPISVGIGCDISGSMRWATESVASAAWMIARAVHRNDGDTATVAYGENVHGVVRPGERPAQVRTFDANGGSENWTGAMRALSGALRMDRPEGVRLMVFISDGRYTMQQRRDGDLMAARLMKSGVKILWIGFRGPERDLAPKGAEYVRIHDPSQMGAVIGAAMVKALERA